MTSRSWDSVRGGENWGGGGQWGHVLLVGWQAMGMLVSAAQKLVAIHVAAAHPAAGIGIPCGLDLVQRSNRV